MSNKDNSTRPLDRRDFLLAAGATAGAALVPSVWARAAAASNASAAPLSVGVIGCGGRGTGAAFNILEASPDVRIVALADVFEDRLAGSRKYLKDNHADRATIDDDRCYTGFDAYKKLLAEAPDIVILATPPHFRPIHLAAAIDAGVHVFTEKPVAVDPAGIRQVIAASKKASANGQCIVAGTQRRHEKSYLEAMRRVRDGQIGDVVAASCYWNQGGLWMNERQSSWSDMEWQLRNWLYFTWLSGDHITEQHVHNLDVVNWAMDASPTRAMGMGGRQVRTDPAYGHIFDHFSIEYEYASGAVVTSYCRQIDGCDGRVEERIHGTKGTLFTQPGYARIVGESPWQFEGENPNPYVLEHVDLISAITKNKPINEGERVAHSTLTAIMGRMSAYTGKELSWDQAMNSKLDLAPAKYELGQLPTPEVAVPGRTPLI